MKDIAIRIVNIALVVVTVFLTLMSGVLLYYKTIGKDKVPSAITSTYATTVENPQTGEQLPTIEANYYSNRNDNGYEVIELLFNCYSGISKQAIYSRGFQLVINEDGTKLYQYNRYDGVNFETGHEYEWGDIMVIDINGTTYGVALDGTYTITTKNFNLGKAIWHTISGLFTGWNYEENAYNYDTKTYEYTFEDLLIKVGQILKSSSNGTGDSVISLVDLGDFLHIYEIDENGQVSGEPVGNRTLTNSYFTMQTHYDNRGMVWAKQSMFGSVAGDSQFNISGIADNVDYWKVTSEVRLTEQDFVARYLTSENGYYYALSTEKINELKNFENIEINVDFNISNFEEVNVLGLDYYALYGLKINSLTISSITQRDFKLLVGSLKDTGLTSIETNSVNLININSGVSV
ncbi:MAG TPA: hypothetical protein IAC38_03355 [Candidatus Caccovivens faecavium]|nr:hypothetical protein [Candidatus Caccovivens faecavium]